MERHTPLNGTPGGPKLTVDLLATAKSRSSQASNADLQLRQTEALEQIATELTGMRTEIANLAAFLKFVMKF